MKTIIAALALTAAIATPAMAGGFRQEGALTPSPAFAYNETAKGKSYRAPTSKEYGAMKASSRHATIDRDRTVRHRRYVQSAIAGR